MVRVTLALLSALVWCVPAGARGQDAVCGEAVRGWVAQASGAIGVPTEAVQCPPSMARLRLHPANAPPLDVEIAEPPGPAFRRAGRLRTSPIVDVPDYGALPEPQREAYEDLIRWLAANQAIVRLDEAALPTAGGDLVTTGWGVHDAGWWLLGMAALLTVLALGVARPARFEGRPALALLAVATTGRIAFGLWGPLHVNGQGPLWIRGALRDPGLLASYGPGYAELLAPIARAGAGAGGESPDTALFAANLVLSALSAPVLYALARVVGLDVPRALFAALLVALDPVAVRISATESYFVPIVTFAFGAALCIAQGAASIRDRDAPAKFDRRAASAIAWVLAGCLLAAQAARIHPVAWLPVALLPLFAAGGERWRARVLPPAIVAAAMGAVVCGTSGAWIAAVGAEALTAGPGQGLLSALGSLGSTGFGSNAVIATALGLAALFVARPRVCVVIALAYALVDLATRHAYGQSELWQASYDRLFAPAVALGLAALAPPGWRLRWALPAAAVIAAALFAVQGPLARRTTTEDGEYRFLREQLARVPEECRVAHLPRVGKRVVEIPDWVLPGSRQALRVRDADDLRAAAAGRCVYWLRTSLCASAEGRPRCDAIESRASLDPPLAARTFAARPSYDALPYDRDRVEVTLRRVRVAIFP